MTDPIRHSRRVGRSPLHCPTFKLRFLVVISGLKLANVQIKSEKAQVFAHYPCLAD